MDTDINLKDIKYKEYENKKIGDLSVIEYIELTNTLFDKRKFFIRLENKELDRQRDKKINKQIAITVIIGILLFIFIYIFL